MKNKFHPFMKLLLLGMVCWTSPDVSAQELAFTRNQQEGPSEGLKPLKKVLQELESRYHVHFAFDPQVVNQKLVSTDGNTGDQLEKTLDALLTPMKLQYKKIDQGVYVIQPVAAEENPNGAPGTTDNDQSRLRGMSGLPSIRIDPGVLSRLIAMRPVEFAVKGRVTDENGSGLPGVSVLIKGTTTGTTTDPEGNYSINVPDGNATLVFSFIGYTSKEVVVGNQSTLDVSLVPDVKALSEVVVVGYQSQKRSDIVGAVAVVDTKEMKKVQAGSVGEMLQGRAPGVTVTSSGAPGQTSAVRIRGTNSLAGQDSPLYVIDGMFINGAYPDFNPNDVESIQVLKDAAATALYGSRGMNGVIIITTKRGKQGAPRVDYNTYVGVQSVPRRLPLQNAAQYRVTNAAAYENAGRTPQNLTEGVDTDWQEELIKNGVITDHNLTLSGGSDKANYLVAGNYFYQDGTIVGPSFRRYQLRVNTEMKRGIFKVGESLMMSRNYTVNINGNPFQEILRMLPTIPVYDPTKRSGYGYGTANENNTFGTNPIALQQHYSNRSNSTKIFGSIFGEAAITSFLTYKLNLGIDFSTYGNKYFERIGRIRQNNPDGGPAFVRDTRGEFFNYLIENTLNFNKTFGKHSISALAGYTLQKNRQDEIIASVQGINGEYWVQNNGTTAPQTNGFINVSGLTSWLGSVNYSFNDKYLVQVNARRDGSSLLGENNRYGTFPSVSAGWRISREGFMQNITAITDLKLRASYGEVGNQAIAIYSVDPVIDYNLNYVLNNSIALGAINRRQVNPNLRWERKISTNIGLDLALLQNRIQLSADYFVARTKDLLIEVPIPLTAGNNGPNPIDNLASIRNRGLELVLTYQDQRGDFKYSASANVTTIRNKVLGLVPTNGNQPIYGFNQVVRLAVNEPISFYALRTDGIFQTQEEINSSAQAGTNVTPGDIRFKDINNDGKIDFSDRERVGSPFPKFEFGLNLSASYKGFDFTAFLAGVSGNYIFNDGRYWTGRYDDNGAYRSDEQYWTGPGTSNTVPKPRIGDPTRNPTYQSDRWLEKGDYARLRNIQLGYTLPGTLFGEGKVLSTLRVYLAGQNVFTLTGYKGYNPEITGANNNNSNLNRGVDNGSYPVSRTFSLGVQAGF